MKKLILALCFLLLTGTSWAGSTVSLEWNPNSEPSLAGYKVYQDGIRQTPDIICLANDASCCEWTSEVLSTGNHSWYVKAYDNEDRESEPSNTVTYEVKLGAPSISITINLNQ